MIGLTAGQTVGWKLRAVEEAVIRQIAADELELLQRRIGGAGSSRWQLESPSHGGAGRDVLRGRVFLDILRWRAPSPKYFTPRTGPPPRSVAERPLGPRGSRMITPLGRPY